MKGKKVSHIQGNIRYRIIQVRGENYVLDMDQHWWLAFFPLLYWFIPYTWYRIHGPALDLLEKKPIVEPKNILYYGGASLFGSNLFGNLLDYLELGFGQLTNVIILLISGSFMIGFRIYGSKYYGSKMEEALTWKDELQTERAIMLPTSFSHIVMSLFFLVLIGFLTVISFYAFVIESNALFLLLFTVFLFMYLVSIVLFTTMKKFVVLFIDR